VILLTNYLCIAEDTDKTVSQLPQTC